MYQWLPLHDFFHPIAFERVLPYTHSYHILTSSPSPYTPTPAYHYPGASSLYGIGIYTPPGARQGSPLLHMCQMPHTSLCILCGW